MGFLSTIASLVGCSPSQPREIKVSPVTTEVEHNQYFDEASKLIKPFITVDGVKETPASSRNAQADIARGIALLDAVIVFDPTNWSAWFMIGKARQALGEREKAFQAFSKSYAIQPDHPGVAREYAGACLNLGKAAEAVAAAERAVKLSPSDATHYSNLALAYTIAGKIAEAKNAITKSLEIAPNDQTSLTVRRIIGEIADGKRPQPHNLRELEGR